MATVSEKMTNLADEIRVLSGTEDKLGLDAMATHVCDANDEVSTQAELLGQIATALQGKMAGSSGEQAAPEISVSSTGLITATAGDKSATKQLSTQGAKTWTPTTSNQTISSGKYLTGTQTIKGDTNLVASNIKSGVSIFGVNGSYEGNSSGGSNTVTVITENIDNVLYYVDSSGSVQTMSSYSEFEILGGLVWCDNDDFALDCDGNWNKPIFSYSPVQIWLIPSNSFISFYLD